MANIMMYIMHTQFYQEMIKSMIGREIRSILSDTKMPLSDYGSFVTQRF